MMRLGFVIDFMNEDSNLLYVETAAIVTFWCHPCILVIVSYLLKE